MQEVKWREKEKKKKEKEGGGGGEENKKMRYLIRAIKCCGISHLAVTKHFYIPRDRSYILRPLILNLSLKYNYTRRVYQHWRLGIGIDDTYVELANQKIP